MLGLREDRADSAGNNHILIIDDDPQIVDVVCTLLEEAGFFVRSASSLFHAKGEVERHIPDLFILDRQLPDGDGLAFCAQLKRNSRTWGIPVLFLSANKKAPTERARGLNVGADDYLTKPFSSEELLARVKALLRRSWGAPAKKMVLEAGPMRMDLDAHKTYLHDKEIQLWPKEYSLLTAFLENPAKVLSRESLLSMVWGPEKETARTPKIVDVTLSNLKSKLGAFGDSITTVRGLGFLFSPPDTSRKSR